MSQMLAKIISAVITPTLLCLIVAWYTTTGGSQPANTVQITFIQLFGGSMVLALPVFLFGVFPISMQFDQALNKRFQGSKFYVFGSLLYLIIGILCGLIAMLFFEASRMKDVSNLIQVLLIFSVTSIVYFLLYAFIDWIRARGKLNS